MNRHQRIEFVDRLNELWGEFIRVAQTPEHDREIERFIEAKDRAHRLLVDLSREDDTEEYFGMAQEYNVLIGKANRTVEEQSRLRELTDVLVGKEG